MAANVVGLDIGSRSLRAVEVNDARKSHPTVVRYREVVLPDGAVSRGEVLEHSTVAAALKRLWSEGKFSSKRVILGMGNHRVVARELTVPKMSLSGIRESLPLHVEELLSVPVAEALLDFYPIAESVGENGPQVNGLLIAAVAAAVRGNVTAVQAAGLQPIDVDLIPFALSRLMRLELTGNAASTDGAVAQIDVGAGTTTVVISVAGVPQFIRLIPTGGQDLTQALTIRLSIETDAAEALKRSSGFARSETAAVNSEAAAVIREVTTELLNSLRNTVSYFSNTRHSQPVRRIVLSGGGAQIAGFASELSALTRVAVSAPEFPSNVGFGRGIDAHAFKSGGTFSVALGLALGAAA